MGKREAKALKGKRFGKTLVALLVVPVVVGLAVGSAYLWGEPDASPVGVLGASGEPEGDDAASLSPEEVAVTTDRVLVPEYPSIAERDTAFVSEVMQLDSWNNAVVSSPGNLDAWKREVVSMGVQTCRALDASAQMGVTEGALSDPIDQLAFATEAAYYLCAGKLKEMGQGISATGQITPISVQSKCPTAPDIDFSVRDFTVSKTGTLFDADWKLLVTNNSQYGVLFYPEMREVAEGWDGDWTTGIAVADYDPMKLAPGGSEAFIGSTGGTYEWEDAQYRVAERGFIPLNCGHEATELA